MTHLNPKNVVQEWCQRNNRPLPIYKTNYMRGESHIPRFLSVVTIDNKNIEGKEKSTKKKAELSAAKNASKLLDKQITSQNIPKYTFSYDKNTYILVDLENVQCLENIKNTNFGDSVTVLLFVSKLCPLNIDALSLDNVACVIRVDSCIKDAADIAIVAKTVELLKSGVIEEVIIVSRDHFAGALSDCIKQGIVDDVSGELLYFTNYQSLISHFETNQL